MSEELRPQDSKAPNHKETSVWLSILVWSARLLCGATFIFSGFVKAVDPWGTIFKLQEYFDAMHLSQLSSIAIPLAFVLFALEFVIGVSVLMGCYRRLSVRACALFMAVMLPLTFWIAIKNPVADCGCFGDALPLSNWATFWKNVILTLVVIWLNIANRRVRCLITPALQWIAFSISALYIILIGWIGYYYQPLIDFRPYPIGTPLSDNTVSNDTLDEVDMLGIYEKNGKRIQLPLDSIPDDSWVFVDRIIPESGDGNSETENHTAIYDPEDDSDVTAEVLNEKGDQFLVFYSPLAEVSVAAFYRINSLYNYALAHGIQMSAITSGTPEEIEEFRDISLSEFPIYLADDTWIKEVVRGNPGIVMLRDGRILWKSSLAAMSPDDFMSASASEDPMLFAHDSRFILFTICWIYIALMLALSVASLIPGILRSLNKKRHNKFIKKGIVASVFLVFCLGLNSCSSDEPDVNKRKVDSATLIYMVAHNSLMQASNNDIAEILEGCEKIDLSKNKVYVFIASPYYDIGLYECIKDKNGNTSLKLVKKYNNDKSVVNPEIISEVIEDFREVVPSESYGLFLWSHATGWIPSDRKPESIIEKSFGDDYGFKIDITQLAQALPDTMMDYIWFDCCLMGGIETCYAFRDKARRIVCSPTLLMAEGAPYQIILPILASREHDEVAAAKAEYTYYLTEAKSSLGFTIAVVDCAGLPELASQSRQIVAPSYPYISTNNLQSYGVQTVTLNNGKRVGITFYDFAETFCRYAESRNCAFSPFEKALAATVIYKAATPYFDTIRIDPNNFSGLSVYVPISPDAMGYNADVESFYNSLEWSQTILR